MEYDKAVREIRQKEDAGSRQSALRSAGANRDRQLAKAVGQFSESSTSGKKGYDMEKHHQGFAQGRCQGGEYAGYGMECPAQRQEYKFFRRFHHPEGRDKKAVR